MNLKAFRKRVEAAGGEQLLLGMASHLLPNPPARTGRLRETLRLAKAALAYHPERDVADPGFPAPLLARLSPHVWHILSAWIDRAREVTPETRAEMLRLAAGLHFFAKSLTNARARELFLAARNETGPFPGKLLWDRLTADADRNLWLGLLCPDEFEKAITDEEGNQTRAVLANTRDLVIWFQRETVYRWFPHYDPTLYTGRGAEMPYDMDHIVPRAHFDQRSSRGIEQAPRFWAVRDGALYSPGNLRLWPRSENRRDQDKPLAQKALLGPRDGRLPDDSYLRSDAYFLETFGEVRRASGIPEEDLDLWAAASPADVSPNDWSHPERLAAFDEAVQRRRLAMYRAFYEALELGAWRALEEK